MLGHQLPALPPVEAFWNELPAFVLHAFNTDKDTHRSYRVDRIRGAQVTNETFVPRYEVELTPQGPVDVQPTARRDAESSGGTSFGRRPRSRRSSRTTGGPRHVYECCYCGKRFYRKTRSSRLNPHKDKSGYACPGRHAIWVDTRY